MDESNRGIGHHHRPNRQFRHNLQLSGWYHGWSEQVPRSECEIGESKSESQCVRIKDHDDDDTAMRDDSAANSSISVDYLLRAVEEMHQLH